MKNGKYLATTTSLLVLAVGWSVSAKATDGDVIGRDQRYNTVTYIPHRAKCGGEKIDINFKQDYGAPLYAP